MNNGYKVGDMVLVTAVITERIETKNGVFYMVAPSHIEATPYQSMRVSAADIFPAQEPEVAK